MMGNTFLYFGLGFFAFNLLGCASTTVTDNGLNVMNEAAYENVVDNHTDRIEKYDGITNTVTRVHEDPRVTQPYGDAQWKTIGALGRRVDADLVKLSVSAKSQNILRLSICISSIKQNYPF